MRFVFILFVLFVADSGLAFDLEALREKFRSFDIDSLTYEEHVNESPEVIKLGRLLFFDTILSGNRDISCAHCHHPHHASVDNLPVSIGTGGRMMSRHRRLGSGKLIARNAPAVFNLGYSGYHTTMWDGRISWDPGTKVIQSPEPAINGKNPQAKEIVEPLTSIAAVQALFPVTSHDEMRGQKGENEIADSKSNIEVWERLFKRLMATQRFPELFYEAYPDVPREDWNFGYAAQALGAYQSMIFKAGDSRFDKFMDGRDSVLRIEELKGAEIFLGKGRCASCHSGSHFTDFQFHSIAAPQLGPGKKGGSNTQVGADMGLFHLTGRLEDRHKFKTPSLRNVELTSPYTHAGALKNLELAVRWHLNPVEEFDLMVKNPGSCVPTNTYEDFVSLVDLDFYRMTDRVRTLDRRLPQEDLTDEEVSHVVAFLKTLTDRSFQKRQAMPLGNGRNDQ